MAAADREGRGHYDRLSRYEGEPGVVVAYASMCSNTEPDGRRAHRTRTGRQGIGPLIRVCCNLTYADPSIVLRDVFRFEQRSSAARPTTATCSRPWPNCSTGIKSPGHPHRKFGWFGVLQAGASVRLLSEFAQKMKWEPLCEPVEMKQGFSRHARPLPDVGRGHRQMQMRQITDRGGLRAAFFRPLQ